MKTVKFLLVIAALFLSGHAYSQNDIITDRPDQSESPYLVDKGYIQFELGVAIERVGVYKMTVTSDELTITNHSYPSVLFRYGLSKNIELRAGIEYIQEKYSYKFDRNYSYIAPPGITESGLSPLTLGTKIHMIKESGAVPQTALLLNIAIPFKEDSPFQSEYIGTDFRFTMTNNLNNRFALSYNLGAEFGSGSPGATGIYSVSLGAALAGRLSAFAELYGFLPQKTSPDHRFDAGLTYLFLKNVQADASFGLGISEKSPDYFVGAGVSFRLPK